MSARDVASQLKNWAISQRLLAIERQPAGVASTSQTNIPIVEDPAEYGFVEDELRSRGINFIGFNDVDNVVIVFTERAIPKRAIKNLPSQFNGIEIQYEKGALPTLGSQPPETPYGVPSYYLTNDKYTCGSSVGLANTLSAGTLGALVKDVNGNLCGLTNNHVAGGCNYAKPNFPVIAPGLCDVTAGGLDPFTLGRHLRLIEMGIGDPQNVNILGNTDATLFKIKDAGMVSSQQGDFYDTPTSVSDLEPGQIVEKVGRTTGRTKGKVRAQTVGPEPVYYRITEYGFEGHVYFDPLFIIQSDSGPFSDAGDSGSLVTTQSTDGERKAVGIIVAGRVTRSEHISYALPLKPVLERLNVNLIGQHNL